ncbi:inositol monophosphatase 1 [Lycorma delicatula]|uniref:inositol monophosphatase 1 n=1 Tax=Lycorma delicatula TaxID=130591 RepID=UPI003F513F9F
MTTDVDKFYDVVLKLTKEAGKLVKERVWEQKTVETKSCDIDFVTETDKEVEKLLINGLLKEFPDHKFIGEETTDSGVKPDLTCAPTWIIDPVDGTMNFVHGYPCVCISIGLLIGKVPQIGIIYNPVLEQLFTAKKGQGAFLNGKKIKVSSTTELAKSLITFEFGTSRDPEKMAVMAENVKILTPSVQGIRSVGSAAWNMAMVALGGSDSYFEFGLHAWDMAAGDIIIREAGGVVIDPAGGPFDVMSRRLLCAGTSELAEQLMNVIKQYYPPRDA